MIQGSTYQENKQQLETYLYLKTESPNEEKSNRIERRNRQFNNTNGHDKLSLLNTMEDSTQKQNVYSFQVHMEYCLG